jgi:signal transduction histidine kinase
MAMERKGFMNPDRIEQVYVYPMTIEGSVAGDTIIRISDVTEARWMERQLVQSEKLASIGLLVAGVAHEINNPNNFISFNIPVLRTYLDQVMSFTDNYAESHADFAVLGMSYPDFREDIFKLLDNLEHGSSRISATVSALRDFARERGQGEKSWVDLKVVLEKAMAICKGRIIKLVRDVVVNLPDELPPVFTDPMALEQVLVNLLINAAQAADKDNSWIKLNVTRRERRPEAEQLIIEVNDNGGGMDAATQRRIFDPFFTTKGPGVGTGLGLSISHRLVEELGGHIEVSSEVGLGSTFRVILSLEKEHGPESGKEI